MKPEQFERWMDFSIRMARTCYARNRRPYVWEIVENVESFFDDLRCYGDGYVEAIRDWDNSYKTPSWPGSLVCDICAVSEDGWIRQFWCDQEHGDKALENARDQWAGPVRCCIRAGLDVAVAPSAGVLGFTTGDIRRMYPEGVPAWITEQWDNARLISVKSVWLGVGFIPEDVGASPSFAEMADNDPLWL